MLAVMNFPVLVIFFFAVFAYLLLKMFSVAGRSETRDIFEFYLTSNEILRDDERRWFGFEIQEAIARGESIAQRMSGTPPLVTFTLGALHNRIGDHKTAVVYLSRVLEHETSDEKAFVHPSPELRSYVRVLRKIEREPADAPLTSAAVRALERARKIRGTALLAESRAAVEQMANAEPVREIAEQPLLRGVKSVTDVNFDRETREVKQEHDTAGGDANIEERRAESRRKSPSQKTKEEQYSNRKPISEVLHDIYDGNIR
jgi:hypothetical protein